MRGRCSQRLLERIVPSCVLSAHFPPLPSRSPPRLATPRGTRSHSPSLGTLSRTALHQRVPTPHPWQPTLVRGGAASERVTRMRATGWARIALPGAIAWKQAGPLQRVVVCGVEGMRKVCSVNGKFPHASNKIRIPQVWLAGRAAPRRERPDPTGPCSVPSQSVAALREAEPSQC